MTFASILYFCRALHDGIIMADDKLYKTVKYLINVYKISVYRKCEMNVFGEKKNQHSDQFRYLLDSCSYILI